MSQANSPAVDWGHYYEQMLEIRRVEERVAEIYPTDVVKSPIHLSIGQEAPSVAVCAALASKDKVVGTYRGHALYLARGGSLQRFVAELYGKASGCGAGKAGSMHMGDRNIGMPHTSAIVATGVPNALGIAFAQKAEGAGKITACFIGDGAVDEGAFSESLNFASLKKLPLLIVVENNQFAIHSPLETRMPRPNFIERAAAYDLAGASVMGNDFEHMLNAAREATAYVRSGQGAYLLEIATYRWKEHVGPLDDWHLGYRDQADAKEWFENDPIAVVGNHLEATVRLAIQQRVQEKLDKAFEKAENAPFPDPSELWDHVYA